MTTKYKLVQIEKIAEDCGAEIIRRQEQEGWENPVYDLEPEFVFTYTQLQAFAKAMLEASPAQESEPVAWRYRYITGIEHDQWLYSSSIEHVELVLKNLGIDKDKFESEPLFTHPPADKADAERYRWLLSNAKLTDALWKALPNSVTRTERHISNAIDEAMKV